MTLAGFLELWAPEKAAPAALVQLAVDEALDNGGPSRFRSVAEYRGFRTALAGLFEEAPLAADLQQVFQPALQRLHGLGYGLRKERLLSAARAVREAVELPPQVVLDGFFSLSPTELELVSALASRTRVTVVLPEAPAGLDCEERRFQKVLRTPRRSSFQAATLEQETEEIVRRILELAERGVHFREMGIVLRSRNPYGPAIETALARFGIPLRSTFSDPLVAHPATAYLLGVVRALLAGWPTDAVAELLRMPVSGVGATPDGDRLDFELRNALGRRSSLPEGARRFESIQHLAHARFEAAEWPEQLRVLRKLIPDPVVTDRVARHQASAWASTEAALADWDEAIHTAATFCAGKGAVGLKQFWECAETAIAVTPLRVRDRRRDAVALLDVFEARQWQLRVVFVCGLVERFFPLYHREDPILGDQVRANLGLPTAADRQNEERFLFDLAVSRATDETVLSYARFNEKGDPVLPSFFLDHEPEALPSRRVRPEPSRPVEARPSAIIQGPAQIKRLTERHKLLSASSVEDFIQCPFLFFGRRTMRLKERPPKPRDRLDVLAQGSILHRALAAWANAPLFGPDVFDRIFEQEALERGIPDGYRTEAVRLELLRNFEAFLRSEEVPLPGDVRLEEKFVFPLNASLGIRGVIDRLDVKAKDALVIDYKYSAEVNVNSKIKASEEGDSVQAGLYLLAAEKAFGLKPVGMLYCGLRKSVSWTGWHLNRPDLVNIGEARTPEALRDLMRAAESATLAAHEAILTGRVAPAPKDRTRCKRCDFRDVCRVQSTPAVMEAGE
jgi:ATP-dependent helicase/DNAse subunit B